MAHNKPKTPTRIFYATANSEPLQCPQNTEEPEETVWWAVKLKKMAWPRRKRCSLKPFQPLCCIAPDTFVSDFLIFLIHYCKLVFLNQKNVSSDRTPTSTRWGTVIIIIITIIIAIFFKEVSSNSILWNVWGFFTKNDIRCWKECRSPISWVEQSCICIGTSSSAPYKRIQLYWRHFTKSRQFKLCL